MTARNTSYLFTKKEKRAGVHRFHLSKEMILAAVTCLVAFVAMLPASEVLTEMLVCAMDIPEEGWSALKVGSRIFLFLISVGLSAVVYSHATDEN